MNRLERLENLSAYIDGELSENEQRLLSAWCEHHPEDVDEYEALAEVVRQIRALPPVEPPAGLRDRILRAVAEAEPVEVSREQAIDWLDDYLDGELSAPRAAVVEHYLAVDAEFAEMAELQAAMLSALAGMDEAEPPSDLADRIRASVNASPAQRAAAVLKRPHGVRPQMRRRLTVGAVGLAAAALLFAATTRPSSKTATSTVAVTPPPVAQPAGSPLPSTVLPPVAQPGALANVPELPADESNQPVVKQDMGTTSATKRSRPAEVVAPRDTKNVASSKDRAPSSPARIETDRESAPTPRAKSSTRTRPSSTKPTKRTPQAKPAPNVYGGALAGSSSSGSTNSGPEFTSRTGSGSVLGNDADGNNTSGDGSRGTRGGVDPTRRTKAPPF